MFLYYLKKSAYNTFAYGAGSFITRIMSFLFLPYFLNQLSIEEFGRWDFYQNIFSLGTLIFTSIAATGMIRFFFVYQDDQKKQKQSIGNMFLLTLFWCIVSFVLITIARIVHIPLHKNFIIIFINILFFSQFSLLLAYLRTKEYLKSYCFILIIQNFLTLLLSLLAITYNFKVESFFLASSIASAFFCPFFLYITYKHRTVSFSIFKKQCLYSLPLLIYGILYGLFFTVDRLILKEIGGYEILGSYSLLWKFGAIFQFFAIALMDASPIIIFNVQNENNSDRLLSKILLFFGYTLTTVGLAILWTAQLLTNYLFPSKYSYLTIFLAPFFLSLILLELARLTLAGITLSKKTLYAPLLTGCILSMQIFLLYSFSSFRLFGIFLANILTFSFFMIGGYTISSKVYSKYIFDIKRLKILISLLLSYIILFQFSLTLNTLLLSFLILCSWPIATWFFLISAEEKQWAYKKIAFYDFSFKTIYEQFNKTIF